MLKSRIAVCLSVCLALVCGAWALNNHYLSSRADPAGPSLQTADNVVPNASWSFAPREYVRLTRPIRLLQAE